MKRHLPNSNENNMYQKMICMPFYIVIKYIIISDDWCAFYKWL